MPDSTYLDWPFLEDHHRQLAHDLRAWAEANLRPMEHEVHGKKDVDDICLRLVKMMGAAGWLRLTVPAAYGGMHEDLDVRSIALGREIFGYYLGLADFSFVMQGLGTGAISLFGSDELKAEYLPRVGSGERLAALAMSEPQGGSDVAALETTADRDGNHFVLNGTKTWISNGGIADHYVVIARTGEAPGSLSLLRLRNKPVCATP